MQIARLCTTVLCSDGMTHYVNDSSYFTQADVTWAADESNVNNVGWMADKTSDTFQISYLPVRNEFPSFPLLDLDGIVLGGCLCECLCKLIVLIFVATQSCITTINSQNFQESIKKRQT